MKTKCGRCNKSFKLSEIQISSTDIVEDGMFVCPHCTWLIRRAFGLLETPIARMPDGTIYYFYNATA